MSVKNDSIEDIIFDSNSLTNILSSVSSIQSHFCSVV